MKQNELASIINQLNELLLTCNTLMCNNELMEDARKLYGFNLLKIPSDKYKSGFYYAVRYKDENGKWLSTKKSTNTDNETLANAFAIENKERIIKEYKEHIKRLEKKNDGKAFYKMLEEYYTPNSKYLTDDKASNIRMIPKTERIKFRGVIKKYFIPYFKAQKINSIKEINVRVYNGLKTYLQNKNISTKTINNYLTILNRILKYHDRNELIVKMPYSKGQGMVRILNNEKENAKTIVPIEALKGVFNLTFGQKNANRDDDLQPFMLSLIGLTTGMRDSEIGRIKRKDIIYKKNENVYLLTAYNIKTDYYNQTAAEKYRKIPLHPFVIEKLKNYIIKEKIGYEDYIFGVPKENEDTQNIDGYLHWRKPRKAIIFLYRQIKIKEKLLETGNIIEASLIADKDIEDEMEKKHITFYSLRHTFNTLCVLYRFNNTNTDKSDDLIDYFMAHNSGSKMRAVYTHINDVSDKIFYDNYGKFVIDMLNKFVFISEEKDVSIEKFVDEHFNENKELFDTNGTIDSETAVDKIFNPLIKKIIKDRNENNNTHNDDIFLSE